MERMFVLTQYNSVSLHRHITQTYKFDIVLAGASSRSSPRSRRWTAERWFQGTADAVRQQPGRSSRDLRGELGADPLRATICTAWITGNMLRRPDREPARTSPLAVMPVLAGAGDRPSSAPSASTGTGRVVGVPRKALQDDRERGRACRWSQELLRQAGASTRTGPTWPRWASTSSSKSVADQDCLDNDLQRLRSSRHARWPSRISASVQAHFFNGYWRDIGTIRAFYDAHMDLLEPQAPFDFYDRDRWPFFTHPRYLPGSRLTDCRFNRTDAGRRGDRSATATIERSVIGVSGRSIRTRRTDPTLPADGGRTRVTSRSPAPGSRRAGHRARSSVIENAIIDKNVRIGRNVRIVNAERRRPTAEGTGLRDPRRHRRCAQAQYGDPRRHRDLTRILSGTGSCVMRRRFSWVGDGVWPKRNGAGSRSVAWAARRSCSCPHW